MIKFFKISFLVLFLLFNIFLVSRELLNFNRFYNFELYGFAHEDVEFKKVCSLETPFIEPMRSEAVASTREDSLLYKTTSKLLYNKINPFVTHRIVTLLSYIIFIISSCFFVLLLTKNYAITFLFLSYTALFAQFLSYYFEYKLTNTSLALISFTYLFVYLFHTSLVYTKKSSYIYAFFLPFILFNLGFEVFCISRPLNIALFAFIFLYLCIYYRKQLISFIAGTSLSVALLKYCHPSIKSDLSLFSARGESLHLTITNWQIDVLTQYLIGRLNEIKYFFHFPRYNIYISESSGELGFLDIIIALSVAIIICLITAIKKNRSMLLNIKNNLFLICFTIVAIVTSFCTPFFSITNLRGHRFANFYYASIILLVIFINIIFHKAFAKYKILTSTIFIAIASYIFYFNTNIFINYNFNTNIDGQAQECLPSIKKLSKETKDIKVVDKIIFCDNTKRPIYYPSLSGVLYLTGLACKRSDFSNDITVLVKANNEQCVCPSGKNDICLIREEPCDIKLVR